MNLSIRSRNKLIFHGEVEYVSSINNTGPFDILSNHANFITLIKESIVMGLKGGKVKKYLIRNGVMRVHKDQIDTFINLSASTPDSS